MLYKIGILADDGEFDIKDIKEVLGLHFPFVAYISSSTETEEKIIKQLQHDNIQQNYFDINELDMLLVFWTKSSGRCKKAIQKAHQKSLPTIIYYERQILTKDSRD